MVKKIGLAILGILVVLMIVAAVKDPNYTISRSITINAPADKIFPYLNSTKLGELWGPWKEVDPTAQMVISGPEEGVGAKSSWDSTGQLGTGSATIVESVPNEKVGIRLEYTKPMNMVQDSLYLVEASGAQSLVTWKVSGQQPFISRFICLFMNMDKMVGDMFEKGLSNLKTLVEKPAQ